VGFKGAGKGGCANGRSLLPVQWGRFQLSRLEL